MVRVWPKVVLVATLWLNLMVQIRWEIVDHVVGSFGEVAEFVWTRDSVAILKALVTACVLAVLAACCVKCWGGIATRFLIGLAMMCVLGLLSTDAAWTSSCLGPLVTFLLVTAFEVQRLHDVQLFHDVYLDDRHNKHVQLAFSGAAAFNAVCVYLAQTLVLFHGQPVLTMFAPAQAFVIVVLA